MLRGSFDKTFEYNNIREYCTISGDLGGIYNYVVAGQGGWETLRFNYFNCSANYLYPTYLNPGPPGGEGIQIDGICTGDRFLGNIAQSKRNSYGLKGDSTIANNLSVNSNQTAFNLVSGTCVQYDTNAAALGNTTFTGTQTGLNVSYSTDPGFFNWASDDCRLYTTSRIYTDLPGFVEIPVEMMGLYNDEIRSNAPAMLPQIDNPSSATAVNTSSATLNGQITFPWLNPDTNVRAYWGVADGGTSVAGWANCSDLGTNTRGSLSTTGSGLAPKTKYYYRFMACNTSGTSWASTTRSFVTAGSPTTKANNTTNLDQAGSWVENTAPEGGLAVWDSNVITSNTTNIGGGVSFFGIQITNPGGPVSINSGTAGSLKIGSGGIDLSTSGVALTMSAPIAINLTADQTWITGTFGTSGSTQITAGGVISGAAQLTIAAVADRGVALTGTNTFSGGLVLQSGGRVVTGVTNSTASGGVITSGHLGTGPLTINGGVISTTGAFGLDQGVANTLVRVNADFAINPAGRIMLTGTFDLGSATRTISTKRTASSFANAVIAGGNTSWGLGALAGITPVVTNGSLHIVRDPASSNYVCFRLGYAPVFAGNAGLIIGSNVVGMIGGADLANSDPTKLATLTIEAGGYMAMCESSTGRNAQFASLSGSGEIGNYTVTTASTSLVTLTINGGQLADSARFAGRIVDTNPSLSASSTAGRVNVVKSGISYQELAGACTYTGSTTVNAGVLNVTGAIASVAPLTVSGSATLAGSGTIASPSTISGTLGASGTLTFTNTVSMGSASVLDWSMLASSATAAPVVVALSSTVASGASIDLNFADDYSTVSFADPFWAVSHSFTIFSAPAISGTFNLRSVSPDIYGASYADYGLWTLTQSSTSVVLNWVALSPVEAWRYQNFGFYTNTGVAADDADPDGDAYTNWMEFNGGTDPNDAQNYPAGIWTATSAGVAQNWSTAANWSLAAIPPSGPISRLEFLTGLSVASGTINASNDLAGTFVLNQLSLNGAAVSSTATAALNVTGSAMRLVTNGANAPAITLGASGTGFATTVSNNLVLDATTSLAVNGSAKLILAGAISGSGGITRSGTDLGVIALAGSNSYTGVTTISSGTLQIGNDGPTGSPGSGAIANNGVLRFDRTGLLAVPNPISGNGSVLVDCPANSGTIALAGSNSFTGNVTITGGALRITGSNSLGSGAKSLNVTTSGAYLQLDGSAGDITVPSTITFFTSNASGAIFNEAGNNTITGNFSLTSGNGNTKIYSDAGTLTLSGTLLPIQPSRTLDLAGAGTGIITGGVLNGSGTLTLAVAKNDAGTWKIMGAAGWTGNTSINAGTLVMDGSKAAGGTITVGSGATLSGSGNIAAATVVSGTLAPGDGVGTLTTTGTVSFNSTGHLRWELASNSASSGFDLLNATVVTATTGAVIDVVLNSGTAKFSDSFWFSAHTWPVIAAATQTGTFALGSVTADSAGQLATASGSFALVQGGSGVNLSWTPLAPAAPASLTGTAGNAQVQLSWVPGNRALAYYLKRATVSGGPYSTIVANTSNLAFVDSTVLNETTYYYVVTGSNSSGESAPSTELIMRPLLPFGGTETTAPGVVLASGTAQCSLATVGGRSYQLQRSDTLAPGSWINIGQAVTGNGSRMILLDPAATGSRRFYRVQIGQ